MSKYNIFATRQDWEKLYKVLEEKNIDVKPFKKMTSMDMAVTLYALITKDYSLTNLKQYNK